jgi:predicted DsbA family dithiol-disulfide isomerase
MAPLTIDIVSDVVCPWCYLGKRRLEAALARVGREDAIVRWRPFQLDETIPLEGMDRQAYMKRKFGDLSRLTAVHERLVSFGEEVGAVYDFDAISRAPNTLKAHRLIRWAGEAGAQDVVVERLFQAYFEQGRDIGDNETLSEIAAASGMDGEDVRRRLLSDEDIEAAQTEIDAWRRAGVSGVPFFIFDGKLAVSGAQTVEVLASAMIEVENQPTESAQAG